LGVESVVALSQPTDQWKGFRGRVTDYLRSLPSDWPWHTTDFYLCGNGEMLDEVRKILLGGRGVDPRSVHLEAYFAPGLATPVADSGSASGAPGAGSSGNDVA